MAEFKFSPFRAMRIMQSQIQDFRPQGSQILKVLAFDLFNVNENSIHKE